MHTRSLRWLGVALALWACDDGGAANEGAADGAADQALTDMGPAPDQAPPADEGVAADQGAADQGPPPDMGRPVGPPSPGGSAAGGS